MVDDCGLPLILAAFKCLDCAALPYMPPVQISPVLCALPPHSGFAASHLTASGPVVALRSPQPLRFPLAYSPPMCLPLQLLQA